jgi:hypothetical protein
VGLGWAYFEEIADRRISEMISGVPKLLIDCKTFSLTGHNSNVHQNT